MLDNNSVDVRASMACECLCHNDRNRIKYLEIESAKLVGLKRRRAFHLSQCRNYILSKLDFMAFKNTTDQGNWIILIPQTLSNFTKCHFFVKMKINVNFNVARNDAPCQAAQHFVEGVKFGNSCTEIACCQQHLDRT